MIYDHDDLTLYRAFYFANQAASEFTRADALLHTDKHGSKYHHRNAMMNLDKLAKELGLELVERKQEAA